MTSDRSTDRSDPVGASPLCPYGGARSEAPSTAPSASQTIPAGDSGTGFVALSKFVIANGMTPEVKQAFLDRPHLVDDAPGFIRMDVISPIDTPDEIWLITFWRDEESYRIWHRSHAYRSSHEGIPKGLRLDPKETSIRLFAYVSS